MGAKILVENIKSDWAEISLYYNNKIQTGYVPTKHIVKLHHKVKDWVEVAQLLEGTPYKWGGRDTIGLDCSALLQLSYQTYGETIPRNTSQQIQLKKKNIKNINDLKRGCVIFWKGHVGIMIDSLNCIHANTFHMKTKTEPLFQIIGRIDEDFNVIKMMDFN
jgi:cell wall-associated NlpC family hydrolase